MSKVQRQLGGGFFSGHRHRLAFCCMLWHRIDAAPIWLGRKTVQSIEQIPDKVCVVNVRCLVDDDYLMRTPNLICYHILAPAKRNSAVLYPPS